MLFTVIGYFLNVRNKKGRSLAEAPFCIVKQ